MKKTEWFPSDVKPVHVGVYECRRREFGLMATRMLHWNGRHWQFVKGHAPDNWITRRAMMFVDDGDKWRGLRSQS